MPIRYIEAHDVKKQIDDIVSTLELSHVVPQRLFCFRSEGSKSRRTVARIHGLGKIWQKALNIQPPYIIEVISEHYDKSSEEEKEKILIHELLHIPKGFSGGFRPHKRYINHVIIEQLYRKLCVKRTAKKPNP